METETLQPAETKLEVQQPALNSDEQPASQSDIEQLKEAQSETQGRIDELQALMATVDNPEAKNEYSTLISQLQSNKDVLTPVLTNPTSKNVKKAKGIPKSANNAAAEELSNLSDDIKRNEATPDCSKPATNELSGDAKQVLQNVQNNMQSNIQGDDFLKKHAESIVFNNGTAKLNDELLENLIFINAVKSLPVEQKNTLESMTTNMKDGLSLNNLQKINYNFASEGLISIASLNEACHAEKCHHSNDNSYTKQVIAANSFANAMQVGQVIAHEYMEQAMHKHRENGVKFVPETKALKPEHVHQCGRVASEPVLDTHLERRHN